MQAAVCQLVLVEYFTVPTSQRPTAEEQHHKCRPGVSASVKNVNTSRVTCSPQSGPTRNVIVFSPFFYSKDYIQSRNVSLDWLLK